jgi:hypothetical protein
VYTHAYDRVTQVKTNPELHNAGALLRVSCTWCVLCAGVCKR